jgi:hypothetical protein
MNLLRQGYGGHALLPFLRRGRINIQPKLLGATILLPLWEEVAPKGSEVGSLRA